MLMNLWVRSTDDGFIHQVGTDRHDSIELFDGKAEYVNIQSMTGTYGGDYEFVEAPDVDDYLVVTPDELRLNRDLIHKEWLAKLLEERSNEI